MSELFSFNSVDGRFKFVVKGELRTKCPDYDKIDTYKLMTQYKLNQYLHNPMGPAIIRLKDNYEEYWLDGQVVSKEVGEKIAHNHQFTNKLTDVINDDT